MPEQAHADAGGVTTPLALLDREQPAQGHGHGSAAVSPTPVDRVFELFTALVLALIVITVFVSTLSRYLFNASVVWSEEIPILLQVWLTFIGGFVALRRGAHVSVNTVLQLIPARWHHIIEAAILLVTLGMLLTLLRFSVVLVQTRWTEVSPTVGFSMSWFMLPLPIGVVFMAVHVCQCLASLPRRDATLGVLWVVGVAAAVVGLDRVSGGLVTAVNPLAAMLVGFLVLLVLNMPIAFALGSVSIVYLMLAGSNLTIVTQRLIAGPMSFVLIAVPLFILGGALMETGGISRRLVALAGALVGHIRGGLAMVVVVSEILFSGISGSTTADVTAVGSLLIPAMKKAGYRAAESVAIVSSASAMGILIPPCIVMVVLAAIANVSVIALFVAGFIPGFLIASGLLGLIWIKARREGWPSESQASLRDTLRAALDAIIPMLSPVIIFGGILSGAVTVTEAAVLAVVYALLVGVLIYRELRPRDVYLQLVDAGVTTSMAFWLIGTASVFSWILAVHEVPVQLGNFISSAPGGSVTFMLFTIFIFIVLGALLDGLPALLILGPVFFPIATKLGIDLIHYGIVVIAAMGIGFFLPPIGVGIFIAAGIAREQIGPVAVAFVPYLMVLIIMCLVVAFVPWFTLVLPQLVLSR